MFLSVTNMIAMFKGSQFNQPIGDWDVSNVTDLGTMFESSNFNQDISNWNVSNVYSLLQCFIIHLLISQLELGCLKCYSNELYVLKFSRF